MPYFFFDFFFDFFAAFFDFFAAFFDFFADFLPAFFDFFADFLSAFFDFLPLAIVHSFSLVTPRSVIEAGSRPIAAHHPLDVVLWGHHNGARGVVKRCPEDIGLPAHDQAAADFIGRSARRGCPTRVHGRFARTP